MHTLKQVTLCLTLLNLKISNHMVMIICSIPYHGITSRKDMFWKKREPKFVIKVKQNRYEKFIIDELRVSADSQEELESELILALKQISQQLQEMNA
jgi:hypothetical protein